MSDAPLVITVDCDYLQPRFAAAYLLIRDGEAAFVDNNTASALPKLLSALKNSGLTPAQVKYVLVTHVHLDHAGGTAPLMEACPNATLLAHPRAAPHLIDPSKLEASARRVYGNEAFEQLYGTLRPVPAGRVRTVEDGETLELGRSRLTFLHTRGHANHHVCIHDSGSAGVFTGDSFGLCYPSLQDEGLFIFPSTSPTDFIAEEARKSIDRILSTGAERAWLTHFGEVTELQAAAKQLLEHLDFSEALLHQARASTLEDSALSEFCFNAILEHFRRLESRRSRPWSADQWALVQLDLRLNADGIAHVAKKLRARG